MEKEWGPGQEDKGEVLQRKEQGSDLEERLQPADFGELESTERSHVCVCTHYVEGKGRGKKKKCCGIMERSGIGVTWI